MTDKISCAGFGAIGALAPDIVLLYSKRWTMPSLTFDPYMYTIATVLYLGLAAIVSAIYPYKRKPYSWKAFGLGVALPVVISALASIDRATIIFPRGVSYPGSLHDLLALF
jgi:hypothetical protein